ncbi:MAG: nuclear transport factor 2 family protein [Deltaproteobacteria bacterium]|nr:MAG: nuclear transport factor 2 family protein [Deltaproteobacteria bacterium]
MSEARGPDGSDGFLAEWHRIVAERDKAALRQVLADDVTLGAPPYWTKLQGRELVQHLLGIIIETIEGFTYHREWCSGDEFALEFTGRVGERELQGIDLISVDASGKIRNLDVLMRPVNAVVALREIVAPRMAAFLEERGSGAA